MRQSSIFFVYRKSQKNLGTTQMRAHQMSELIRPYLPNIKVSLSRLGRKGFLQRVWAGSLPRGAIVFLTKGATRAITAETFEILKRRDCAILSDLVDTHFNHLPPVDPNIDVYLCASTSGVTMLRDALHSRTPEGMKPPQVRSLIHAADFRLYGRQVDTASCLKPLYWGNVKHNLFMTDKVAARVSVIDASTSQLANSSIGQLPSYNMHYCVRPSASSTYDRIKPFTKGANAAVIGAPVLVNRQVQDAVDLLGEDYPYLVNAPDEAQVIEMLDRAKDGFGGEEWKLAQARMADLAERVSPRAIAAQLRGILEEIGR